MKYNKIHLKHPNAFVLVTPNRRNKEGRVSDWKVISTVKGEFEKACELQAYYKSEGLTVCIICTYEDYDKELICAKVAEFFRVYFGI